MDVLLRTLQDEGKTLIIATSKPTVYAERILEYFKIAQYFTFVSGSELNGQRSKKSEIIRYALDSLGIIDIENAVMIGDRKYDIIGAKEIGIDSIGVLYGYGDLQELEDAGAPIVVESVHDLHKTLK